MTTSPQEVFLPADHSQAAITILPVFTSALETVLDDLPANQKSWAQAHEFSAGTGTFCLLPDAAGKIATVLYGGGDSEAAFDAFAMGALAGRLPAGDYLLAPDCPKAELVCLAWMLSAYRFDRYIDKPACAARLVCPASLPDYAGLISIATAVWTTRRLIDTPAGDMGPTQLEAEMRLLAQDHDAILHVVSGEDLKTGFPLIHTVGRAAADAPRLLDLTWGREDAPKVTLVGKGVCFDTGGLNLKGAAGMLIMKKDMGGAANVIGLAQMIMQAGLDLRLRVLVPAVENSVAGDAFRPGDVLTSRKGLSVEIGNTDAEGRLVLADALSLADEEEPQLLIDMATLTGAARVALGPDLPPYYTNDETLAANLQLASETTCDPLWRLPFWEPYREMIATPIASLNNAGKGGFAGSLTAALFLKSFVEKAQSYIHFDIYGWTPTAKPARPLGGEAQGIRALFHELNRQFGKKS